MPSVILIPGILCLAAVFRWGTQRAFLTVVLPVLMFLPDCFFMSVKHLPPITFFDVTLLSLLVGMVLMDIARWKYSRMDLWVALYILSATYSERIPWGINGAILLSTLKILEYWVPYMAGKLLVERPGMRAETVKRIVVLMAVASLLAMPQFFLKFNPYDRFWGRFFPGQWSVAQIREGFGRVGGPYGGGETAGMVLLIGLPIAFWLHRKYYTWKAVGYLNLLVKHTGVILFVLLTTLVLTQSRGPWVGLIIALTIASIGRAKRLGRRAVLVFGLGLLVGVPLYSGGKGYVSGQGGDDSEERQTAQYRKMLVDNYIPIAELGGAWGWGNRYPVIAGQRSIDNEYLLTWMVQGYVGLTALILVFSEATVAFAQAGIKTRSRQECHFIFTLLGIWLGLAVCLTTVWLNGAVIELFFLLAGWSQSIRPAKVGDERTIEQRAKDMLLQATAMRVYT